MRISEAYSAVYPLFSPDLSPASRERHGWDLRRFYVLIGDKEIEEITTKDYQLFRVRSKEAGHSASTTETTLRTVRQTLNACAELGQLQALPFKGRGRRLKRPKPRPATIDELGIFWHATIAATWPRNTPWGRPRDYWRGWGAIAYWTALRLHDLTWTLSMKHVYRDHIELTAEKTGIEHVFPLTDNVRRVLSKYQGDDSQPLFQVCESPNMIRKHLRLICEAAEIRKLIPRNFRQSSITQWTRAGGRAGDLIHGCGMSAVLNAYLDPLEILAEVAPRVVWPFPV